MEDSWSVRLAHRSSPEDLSLWQFLNTFQHKCDRWWTGSLNWECGSWACWRSDRIGSTGQRCTSWDEAHPLQPSPSLDRKSLSCSCRGTPCKSRTAHLQICYLVHQSKSSCQAQRSDSCAPTYSFDQNWGHSLSSRSSFFHICFLLMIAAGSPLYSSEQADLARSLNSQFFSLEFVLQTFVLLLCLHS